MFRHVFRYSIAVTAIVVLLSGCGIRRKKYDNPIAKDTQQPDKVLFDQAIKEIEKSRFDRGRLLLQTLMNTYDTSEYMAKAKLAIADAWYREGGAHGMAQAEAEYKDFILFYPNMEEAAEAQSKICDMQYKQIEKADRDSAHVLRAEDECRQLLIQFPNSKFAPQTQQRLRNIQEILADKEFKVGAFYHHKGSMPAAVNRLQGVADQFPLYSQADEALWLAADGYHRMGDRFEDKQANALTEIVKDYPLSDHADEAKARLQAMNRPVPEADPVKYARMKYELENRTSRSLMSKVWGPFSGRPDMTASAKSGSPQMTGFRPTIPASVPQSAQGTAANGVTDVGAQIAADPNALNTNPEARANAPAATDGNQTTAPAASTPAAPAATTPQQPTTPNAVTRQGVDLNTASEAELTKLPGINKLTAKRIVALRPFLSVNDLIRIGVSKKTIDNLKPAASGGNGKASTK
jgi:outer membrane protein assembly factor BamD